ncbi:hypothetical protein PRUPE_5G244100 [Prunus persica]|uniref:Uncharacterized protein n=1 Tax=Prunus persica TaxID=3760 RepID=A0A251PGM6_PRUPE|nr:hypothetical protein PRUPE_5G244100 [Prunus persica]
MILAIEVDSEFRDIIILQGTLHLIFVVLVILNCITFIVTKKHCLIYLAVAFTISLGTYLGYFRTQMKKKFNIKGSDSSLDDCIYHLICPCCALCQVIIVAEPMLAR